MVKSLVKTSALMAASALISSLPALAQVGAANVRALNVARNWAINNNGGLSVYRPAACMFNTGDGGGSCLTQNNSQGFRFKFLGGRPGWMEQGTAPTTETELQVSIDGRQVTEVIYNGSHR